MLHVDDEFGVELANTVYALDATTIDLCLSVFPWAPFRSTKAAVKSHTLLDLRGAIPTFIHISDGKMHDVNVLDLLVIEAGAFYIMDRGYLDFERLYGLDQAKDSFVTRAKRNLDARRLYSAPVNCDTGLICDQTIALNGFYAAKHYPGHLRRIRYRDPESGKTLVFLTNQFALPALTIQPGARRGGVGSGARLCHGPARVEGGVFWAVRGRVHRNRRPLVALVSGDARGCRRPGLLGSSGGQPRGGQPRPALWLRTGAPPDSHVPGDAPARRAAPIQHRAGLRHRGLRVRVRCYTRPVSLDPVPGRGRLSFAGLLPVAYQAACFRGKIAACPA